MASKTRWSLLKSEPYLYDHLVDYREPDWEEQLRIPLAGEGMHHAYDCISEGDTVRRCSSVLASDGHMAIVRSQAGGAWTGNNLPVEPIYGAV